jgi:hypothetical protein
MSVPKKTYFDMAKEAIMAIKDRTGSSSQAIKTYITATYPDVAFGQVNSPSACPNSSLRCINY